MAGLFLFLGAAAALKATTNVPIVDDLLTVSRLPSAYNPSPLSELKVTNNVVQLKRAESYSLSAMYLQQLRRQAAGISEGGVSRATNGTVQMLSVEAGQVFLAPVTVGGQDFDVVIDSGSSDPWLVQSDFTCIDYQSGDVEDDGYCYFGTPYDKSVSNTYSPITDENFNISYADGEYLNGDMAYETFTMAGITVPSQTFGVVDYAAWFGDGYSSGLVGFAYRTLTSAYASTNPSADQPGASIKYNPLFVNMYTNQGVPPVFSLAIDRDPNAGGVMAIGGLPSVPHTPVFATTPIIPVGVNLSSGANVYEFYTIIIDGFALAANTTNTQFNPYPTTNPLKTSLQEPGTQSIVDSGTSLLYLANDVAESLAGLFNPPAVFDTDGRVWYVDCDATTPVFGVSVAGKVFYVNGADLVVPVSATDCIMGVQPNCGGLTILGDVWLKNVVAVFDVGAERMRFAAREFYGETVGVQAVST